MIYNCPCNQNTIDAIESTYNHQYTFHNDITVGTFQSTKNLCDV